MNKLAEQLRTADQICTQAYPYFEQAASIRQETETKAAKKKRVRKTISIITGILAGEFLGVIIGTILNNTNAFALGAIAGGVGLGMFLYKGIFLPQIEAAYNSGMKKAAELDEKGTKILEDNIDDLSFMPNDYWYPMATGYMLKIVEAGRAADLNQAMMMFDEQLHRWNVENANAEILSQQKTQTQALKGIRRSSAINAAANVANAAANISRWF